MNTFKAGFFVGNREQLQKLLPGHVLVFTAHSLVQSAADMAFPFRQDSSFWYLTGLSEPDVLLSIDTDSGEATLYLPTRNDYQNEWDGEFDLEELQELSGITNIRAKADLNPLLKKALKNKQKIGRLESLPDRVEPYGFYANPARKNLDELLVDEIGIKKDDLVDVRRELGRLRQIKQPVELEAIQEAIDITGRALQEVKDRLGSFDTEKQAERALSALFLTNDSDGHAFEPIVASGKNAAIIHYEKSQSPLRKGDLVLFDVGAQVHGYAADISRVYAVGGKPTARQQELWDACLEIQQKGFDMLGPGVMIRQYQKKLEAEAHKIFKKLNCSMADEPFPHGFSHFLGLDAHDAGLYDEPLQAGAVITVEPGIYLQDEGIGVRVEDDVLITNDGIKVLSENIPKSL